MAAIFRLFGNLLPLTETQSGQRMETLEKLFVKAKARPDPLSRAPRQKEENSQHGSLFKAPDQGLFSF